MTELEKTMLAALKVQHNALDILLAAVIRLDPTFMPTKSQIWPMLVEGKNAIDKGEAALCQ